MMTVMILLMSALCLTVAAENESHAGIRLKGKLSDLADTPSYSNSNSSVNNSDRRILPKRGDVAVIVEGDDRQHTAIAESMIIEELISRGYRVVDEAKMRRIKMAAARAKAAQYAWEGNIAGLLKLNGSYSVSATILARVRSSIVLMAVAGPKKLGGRTAAGKSIGYSVEEAMRKSLYEAVQNGMQQFF